MGFFRSYQKESYVTLAVGLALVMLIILLGASFFVALSTIQKSSRKEFLAKQAELAATGLELEFNKFQESADLLIEVVEEENLSVTEYDEKVSSAVKRVIKNYSSLIDTVFIDFQDSIVYYTLTSRNDFFRRNLSGKKLSENKSNYSYLVQGKNTGASILVSVNPIRFGADYVKNFYIDPKGKKLLYLDGVFWDLNLESSLKNISEEPEVEAKLLSDLTIGVLGVYEAKWNINRTPIRGILSQYPFKFGSVKADSGLIFVEESKSIIAEIYNTYFLLFIGLIVLILGTIILFVISVRDNLESQRLIAENSAEIFSLFEQQNLLLEELNGFVYFYDAEGRITRVSDEISTVLDVSKENFLKAFNEPIENPDILKIVTLVRKAISENKSYVEFEYDYNDNGRVYHLKIFDRLIFDTAGNFTGGMGICTDITSQYNSRQELIASENRLRILIDNIPDIIFIYDNDGVILDYQIKDSEVPLTPRENILGKKMTELISKDQANEFSETFAKARKLGKIQTMILNAKYNNRVSSFEVKIFPLDKDKVMSISKDITTQRIWEKGLVESRDAANQASKAKSEFLANMSHEIRTPMNGLLGIIELLEQTELDEVQVKYIRIIKNSGNSLLAIIKDILDYSKIEAGKIELYPSVFIPKKEFNNQIQILSGVAKKKKINLTINFSEGTEHPYEGDLEKLMQVFLNLVGNAIKFTPNNGDVQVDTGIEEISEELAILRTSVKDSGIGIEKDLIPHLTDAFYQVDSSQSRLFQGTGLGLAISNKLIELLGGELVVTSELNEGSIFTFTVLLKKVFNQEVQQKKKIEIDRQSWVGMSSEFPLKILLAEDNDLNLQLMDLMLGQLGYVFEVARNGKEAVDLAAEKHFDLILMDVQMPILNGLEASTQIRKLPKNNLVPIIGLSANVFDDDQKKALDAGMSDYLTKPIRLAALAEKLKYYSSDLIYKNN